MLLLHPDRLHNVSKVMATDQCEIRPTEKIALLRRTILALFFRRYEKARNYWARAIFEFRCNCKLGSAPAEPINARARRNPMYCINFIAPVKLIAYKAKKRKLTLSNLFTMRRYALHGLCDRNSVCASVCPSHWWTVSTHVFRSQPLKFA